MNSTPNANRVHIALFGKRNSGKSSLINAITGQTAALVSDFAGTTTDPVYKAMEVHPIGPCVFIDTAGFDDTGELGQMRVKRTQEVLQKTDIAVIVLSGNDFTFEKDWYQKLKNKKIPVLFLINKADQFNNIEAFVRAAEEQFGQKPLIVSAKTGQGIAQIRHELAALVPQSFETDSITKSLVQPQDTVLLVMPQDIQAPKGRLILPQVQTIRDLLDNRCIVISTTTDTLDTAISALKEPPSLIITDSQVFGAVYEKKPPESRLTSFSVLFAKYKGNILEYIKGANAIDTLKDGDRVLIAEACTHAPLSEDIGRVKIPRMLRKRIGENLKIDIVAGTDFPEDLSGYSLIIHCGGCMFNRRFILSRIERAKEQSVPITNYGIAIAKFTGILDKIDY